MNNEKLEKDGNGKFYKSIDKDGNIGYLLTSQENNPLVVFNFQKKGNYTILSTQLKGGANYRKKLSDIIIEKGDESILKNKIKLILQKHIISKEKIKYILEGLENIENDISLI